MLALIALAAAAPVQLGLGADLTLWNQAAVHLPLVGPSVSLRVGVPDRPWSVGLHATAGWSREDNEDAKMRSVPVWTLATVRTWRQRSGFRVGLEAGPAVWTVQTTLEQGDTSWMGRQTQLGFALGPSVDIRITDHVRSEFRMTGIARKSGFDVLSTWQITLGSL